MKKYIIIDLQGGDWWTWTFKKPVTKHELKNMFMGYAEADDMWYPKDKVQAKRYFSFDHIEDIWECKIIPVNKYLKERLKKIYTCWGCLDYTDYFMDGH